MLDAIGTDPEITANEFPVANGVSTDFSLDALMAADDAEANDAPLDWCVGTASPAGPPTDCGRARLNEISLAGDAGERWIEIHAPAGGSLAELTVRIVDADGNLAKEAIDGIAGRMPIGKTVVFADGDGESIPALGSGSVQLLRDSQIVDVYGFGTLSVQVDLDGHPMVEGTPGPEQTTGMAAIRPVDGQDTDDNSADWQQVEGGSPGELNSP